MQCIIDGGQLEPVQRYVFKSQQFRNIYRDTHIYRCAKCGLRQVAVDKVDNEALTKYYEYDYRNVAKIAVAQGDAGPLYFRARGNALASLIDTKPSTIFELGSGYGFNLAAAQQRFPSARLITDEIDKTMAISAERGSLDTGPYDVVLLSHVLEHFTNPLELLQKARRAVSPGGVLIIEVPNDVDGIYPLNGPDEPHITFFTEPTLRLAIRSAGLCETRLFVAGFDNRFKTPKNRVKRAVRMVAGSFRPLQLLLDRRGKSVLQDADISKPNPKGSVLRAVIRV